MRNSVKNIALFLSAALLTFFVSCSDDDDATPTLDLSDDQIDDIVDDIVDSGPVLADGIYIVGPSVSADTTSANLLQAGNVGLQSLGTNCTGFYEVCLHGRGKLFFLES